VLISLHRVGTRRRLARPGGVQPRIPNLGAVGSNPAGDTIATISPAGL